MDATRPAGAPGNPPEEKAGSPAGEPSLKRAIGPKLLILFVIGDILGTGIYATTGKVAGKVGGALWVPFAIGFVVALLTAASYVELVGKYPKAAGAALYTQKAFKVPFLTFIIAFMVMCSGLSSASAAALAFSGDYMSELTAACPAAHPDRRRLRADPRRRQPPRRRRVGQDERRPDPGRTQRPRHHPGHRRVRRADRRR